MKEHKGNFTLNGEKIAIVCSRFNDFITKSLLEGCLDCLARHGIPEKNIEIFWVPGAFEVPLAIQKVLEHKKPVLNSICSVRRFKVTHIYIYIIFFKLKTVRPEALC